MKASPTFITKATAEKQSEELAVRIATSCSIICFWRAAACAVSGLDLVAKP